ncbi:MAG TPA: hypothetical protein VHN99_09990 [Deinococcales bacterium]|nr:hypothetical protein [Deinococcales bacterium]
MTPVQSLHARLKHLIPDDGERRRFVCFVAGCDEVESLNDLPEWALEDARDRLSRWSDERILAELGAWRSARAAASGAEAFESLPTVSEHDLTREQLRGTIFDRKLQREAQRTGLLEEVTVALEAPAPEPGLPAGYFLPAAQRARLIRETAEATARKFGRDKADGSRIDWTGHYADALDQLDDQALQEKARALGVELP